MQKEFTTAIWKGGFIFFRASLCHLIPLNQLCRFICAAVWSLETGSLDNNYKIIFRENKDNFHFSVVQQTFVKKSTQERENEGGKLRDFCKIFVQVSWKFKPRKGFC